MNIGSFAVIPSIGMFRKSIAKNAHELFTNDSIGVYRTSLDEDACQIARACDILEPAVEYWMSATLTDDVKPGKSKVMVSFAFRPVMDKNEKVMLLLWPAILGVKSKADVSPKDPTDWTYANDERPMEPASTFVEIRNGKKPDRIPWKGRRMPAWTGMITFTGSNGPICAPFLRINVRVLAGHVEVHTAANLLPA